MNHVTMTPRRCQVGSRGAGSTALVLDLARPYRAWLLVVLAAMLLETLAGLAGPWPLKIVIDSTIGGDPLPERMAHLLGVAQADRRMVAALAGVSLFGIAAIGGAASYVDNYYTEAVAQWVGNDLRLRIYEHLESLSFRYYDTHETGALLSTMTDDVSTIQDFVSSLALGILVDFTTIVGMLGLMLWLDPEFTLVIVAITPVLVIVMARFRGSVKKATQEVRRRESEVMSVAQAGLESVRTVQALGAQQVEGARLATVSRATVTAAVHARRIKSLLSPTVSVVVAGTTALVLWRGADNVLARTMTAGALTVFLTYLGRFFKPVQDLAKITNALAGTRVALDRIAGILDIDTIVRERPGAVEPGALSGFIAFDHVAFSYDDHTPILRDVTLAIPAGAFVGIVGPTGSGKSTLANLVPRFYDATAGRILIDGIDVCDYALRGLRRQIAVVMQETVLFHGTLRDNIAYGRAEASDAEVVNAARLANADEFISQLPAGYDTIVGERGATLSGGQRQRIGIARAFIRNAPILILDEPTAALDSESESLVIQGMQRLMKRRTVIMITHRLQTLRDASTIVVIRDGTVAEQGTHDELLKRGGVYAGLYWAAPIEVAGSWRAH